MIKLSTKEPFVILIDLDHTIQGNIQPQLIEHGLISFLNSYVLKGKKKLKQSKDDLIKDFMKGLIRPQFKAFILRMKSRFPNVEFFIYTASEDSWAKYIVQIIMNMLNININKRVFTRKDCVYDEKNTRYMKSLDNLKPEIFRILKKKYKLNNSFEFNHIYLIDNNYVLPNEERHYLIKCPDYTVTVNIDYTRSIPMNIVKEHLDVISNYLLGYKETSIQTFFKMIHNMSVNSKTKKDKYWEQQLKVFKRLYTI